MDLTLTVHSHSYERSFLIEGHYDVSSMFDTSHMAATGDGRPTGDGPYVKAVAGPDPERKLALLCHAVLQAHRGRLEYGLRLPGRVIEPDSGERHQKNCLAALALYP